MTQRITTPTSRGHSSSAYSLVVFMPMKRLRAARAMAALKR